MSMQPTASTGPLSINPEIMSSINPNIMSTSGVSSIPMSLATASSPMLWEGEISWKQMKLTFPVVAYKIHREVDRSLYGANEWPKELLISAALNVKQVQQFNNKAKSLFVMFVHKQSQPLTPQNPQGNGYLFFYKKLYTGQLAAVVKLTNKILIIYTQNGSDKLIGILLPQEVVTSKKPGPSGPQLVSTSLAPPISATAVINPNNTSLPSSLIGATNPPIRILPNTSIPRVIGSNMVLSGSIVNGMNPVMSSGGMSTNMPLVPTNMQISQEDNVLVTPKKVPNGASQPNTYPYTH